MPPSVLPSVATASAGQYWCGFNFRTPKSTASDPPGNSVAARKLLANKVHRLNASSMSAFLHVDPAVVRSPQTTGFAGNVSARTRDAAFAKRSGAKRVQGALPANGRFCR